MIYANFYKYFQANQWIKKYKCQLKTLIINWRRLKSAPSLMRRSRNFRRRTIRRFEGLFSWKYLLFSSLLYKSEENKIILRFSLRWIEYEQEQVAGRWNELDVSRIGKILDYFTIILCVSTNSFNFLIKKSIFYVSANNITVERHRSMKKRDTTKGYAINIIYYSRSYPYN